MGKTELDKKSHRNSSTIFDEKINVNIIGPCPPPIGGVSIHVSRLAAALKNKGINVNYFDDFQLPKPYLLVRLRDLFLRKKHNKHISHKKFSPINVEVLRFFWLNWIKFLFNFSGGKTIYHYHTWYWKYRALFVLLALLKPKTRAIFTVHSMREEFSDLRLNLKFYLKFSVRYADHFIVTNDQIKNKLINLGAASENITVMSPFIPPVENDEPKILIDDRVTKFTEGKFPVISANASQFTFYNGEDAYGFDLAIEMSKKLKQIYPNIGVIFMLPSINNHEYFKELNERIINYGLEKNFLFFLKQADFYPILKNSDIFLRPTNTDGDAISIREALHLGIPSVASDCVERPREAVLFRTRDINSLTSVVENLLKNLDEAKSTLKNKISHSGIEQILSLYNNIVSK